MHATALRLGIAAAFVLALTAGAGASAYCPPNGPGAPGYCGNIPHKGKKAEKKPSPKQQRKQTQMPTKAPPSK